MPREQPAWPGGPGRPALGFASRDGFVADRTITGGFQLLVPGLSLRAVHTPGHASNHLCYLLDRHDPAAGLPVDDGPARMLFSGDHVMQGSTVVISPPDGDMADYLASLRRVRDLDPAVDAIAPGHGHLIDDPAAVIDAYLEHRLRREAKVADALRDRGTGTSTICSPVSTTTSIRRASPDRPALAVGPPSQVGRRLEVVERVDVDDPDSVWRWRGPVASTRLRRRTGVRLSTSAWPPGFRRPPRLRPARAAGHCSRPSVSPGRWW